MNAMNALNALVVFYSFTGNTRKVAHELAAALGAECSEFTCSTYGYGLFGGLRQALDVFIGGAPPIELPAALQGNHDLIILAGPVWAARPAPPLRSALRSFEPQGRRLALFLTCDGTSARYPGEKALAEAVSLVPGPLLAQHLFRRADIEGDGFAEAVARFATEIRGAAEPAALA